MDQEPQRQRNAETDLARPTDRYDTTQQRKYKYGCGTVQKDHVALHEARVLFSENMCTCRAQARKLCEGSQQQPG